MYRTICPKKSQEIFNCEKCDYNTCSKKDFNKHILTRKHQKTQILNALEQKNPKNPKNPEILTKKYICEKCHYSTDSKKDFNKHLGTAKHKKMKDAIDSGDLAIIKSPKILKIKYLHV